ncbi:hypothetical protein JCM19301_437 [Jejuia pallidilutea]|uniref:Uncharacterized protein n=1 Tax=Jejuia pallidilutea TaxID=504487 RepID=A0A090VW28_9FLAO|nr:hypothetical protein JCM19301_437 [Jejuia pallidilutea]GAL88756.1 hypothetical protein JCM19538_1191 [Jejuia pallidilutea]
MYIPLQYWLYNCICALRLFCLHCSIMSTLNMLLLLVLS